MESRDRDRLAEWLDGVLRQNEIAEPRPGLEGRILARIAIESKRHRARKSWAWIFATASVAALLVFGPRFWHNAQKAPHLAVSVASRNSVMAGGARSSAPVSAGPFVPNRSERKRTGAIAKAIQEPKLDHFPSRRPLSEQELALASYAERFPAEAALIAREQQKFDQEIARAQEEAENSSSPNQ